MKIECNINNYFKTHNEARGVVLSKRKILKNKNPKCLNYLTRNIILIILIAILVVLLFLTGNNNLRCFGCFLVFLEIISIIFIIICNIRMYTFRKKRNFKSIITIDKEGITDTSFMGIKMIFNWSKIKGVVIKKYSITILTDTPVYFYFDISSKKDILGAIKKYASKDLIIE